MSVSEFHGMQNLPDWAKDSLANLVAAIERKTGKDMSFESKVVLAHMIVFLGSVDNVLNALVEEGVEWGEDAQYALSAESAFLAGALSKLIYKAEGATVLHDDKSRLN